MPVIKSFHVLVAEDEPAVRDLLRMALQRNEIHCDIARDGQAAEQMMRNRQYDMLITDLRMPRMHGHRLILDLLEQRNPIPIVAMTGLPEPALVTDLLSRGVLDVEIKPLNFPIVAAKVRARLQRIAESKQSGMPAAGGVPADAMSHELDRMTGHLRTQLSQVTQSFDAAIKRMEKKRDELGAGFVDSIRVLSNLVSQVGKSGESHAGRVESVAAALGKHCGMDAEAQRGLRVAALLHDLGQFGMPDAVRMKPPWALSSDERVEYEQYPFIGAALLGSVHGADQIVELIQAHAENFDGSGFPMALRGEQIPLGARIIRVADGCDTYLMYGGHGRSVEQAREHLQSHRGKHYDPELTGPALICFREAFTANDAPSARVIDASELRPGFILAEHVYDNEGRFLARAGMRINDSLFQRLALQLGHQRVRIYDTEQDAPDR